MHRGAYARGKGILPLFLFLVTGGMPGAFGQTSGRSKLNIAVIQGEGAHNNLRLGTATEPIVQLEDENGRPVAGAVVVFSLPENGPGGRFSDGTRILALMTNQRGHAIGRGLQPNGVAGQFTIRVSAYHRGQSARTSITQTNVEDRKPPKVSRARKLWPLLLIAGGGAVTALIAAGGGSDSRGTTTAPGQPPPPAGLSGTVLTPGTPRIGPP